MAPRKSRSATTAAAIATPKKPLGTFEAGFDAGDESRPKNGVDELSEAVKAKTGSELIEAIVDGDRGAALAMPLSAPAADVTDAEVSAARDAVVRIVTCAAISSLQSAATRLDEVEIPERVGDVGGRVGAHTQLVRLERVAGSISLAQRNGGRTGHCCVSLASTKPGRTHATKTRCLKASSAPLHCTASVSWPSSCDRSGLSIKRPRTV